MKLAIVSPVLPPSQSGQAVVLYRLLHGTDPDQYILISPTDYTKNLTGSNGCSQKLPGKYFYIANLHSRNTSRLLKLNYYHMGFIKETFLKSRIQQFIEIFQIEMCTHVIACTASLFDPYCAYLASKKVNIPFYLYAFDDYVQQWTNRHEHFFAKKIGPSIIQNAKGIIVPNDYLKLFYNINYGIKANIVHNPVDLPQYISVSLPELNYSLNTEIKIVYTGAIYGAQIDSLNRLLSAISKVKSQKIRLHIFSPDHWNPDNYNELVVNHNSLPLSRMAEIQMDAHILFLPLAFRSDYPETLINTSSPGKIGEYLASGRPIVVHSPPESFVSWYFKKYNCGSVVDSMDVTALTNEIEFIITNKDYREMISKNGKTRAEIDYDIYKIRNIFFKIFK